MNGLRCGLTALVLLGALSVAGCDTHVDRGFELDVGGCAPAHVERNPAAPVLDITTEGCPGAADPIARLAATAWRRLPHGADVVRIRIAGAGSAPAVITRADLELRHGPTPRQQQGDDLVWLMLPVGLIAFAALTLLAAYGASRAGVVVVLTRTSRR